MSVFKYVNQKLKSQSDRKGPAPLDDLCLLFIILVVIFFWLFLVAGCVIQHDGNGKVIEPVPQPTLRPTLPPPIPTMPPPTPEPTPRPLVVTVPKEVVQCEKMLVTITGLYQKDDVVIWAEKKHHIGRMFFDEKNDVKYLGVKLNTAGERVLAFKINGNWAYSQTVLVKPSPESCIPK